MKLNQLRYFVAVCNTGSFTIASEQLYVSRPAVAQAVHELETEFGGNLFYRYNNKIELTENGAWLFEKAQELLRQADSLSNELHARFQDKTIVNIGVAPMIGNLYVYRILNAFSQEKNNFQLNIDEAGSLEIRKKVENNTVELGVCILEEKSPKYNSQKLFDAELKYFVHKNHPLANRSFIDFQGLANQKFCLLKKDSYQNEFVQSKLVELGVPFEVVMYSSQLSSIITMLGYGNCGAFLFGDAAQYDSSIVGIPLSTLLRLPVGVIWNRRQVLSDGANFVRKYIVNKFKNK